MNQWTLNLDDRINPIVIKEMRQALNGRGVILAAIFILMAELIAFAVVAGSAENYRQSGPGATFVITVLMLLNIGSVLGSALPAAHRFAKERKSDTGDLIGITTLKPLAVVNGKFLAVALINLLLFMLCLPALALSYYLRGVELNAIIQVVAVAFMLTLLMTELLLLAASFGIRIFSPVAVCCCWGLFAAAPIMFAVTEALLPVGLILTLGVLGLLLLYTLHYAALLPEPANRMLPVRLAMLIMPLLLAGVLLCAWGTPGKEGWNELWLAATGGGAILLAGLAGLERTRQSRRVLRTLPRRRFGRLIMFLFSSGQAGGVSLSVLLMAAAAAIYCRLPKADMEILTGLAGGFIYVLIYVLISVFLLRRLKKHFPAITPAGILPAVVILAVLGAFVCGFAVQSPVPAMFFAPVGFWDAKHIPEAMLIAGGWLAVLGALNCREYFRELAEYWRNPAGAA